ncbi:MAG TPA: T9SS type A sorting domain-containing protein, partial [Paludibacteraceae bacterium]|nr:T9SS type A sorting domain-containing protein [Paludibacteraceae bacterium]
QNQPNPFVTTTMIRYELPERSSVVLKVYDLFGQEVTTLFEGEQNDGKYEVEFNGTNLPGGIYFCQLQAGNFRTVRKLLLLK